MECMLGTHETNGKVLISHGMTLCGNIKLSKLLHHSVIYIPISYEKKTPICFTCFKLTLNKCRSGASGLFEIKGCMNYLRFFNIYETKMDKKEVKLVKNHIYGTRWDAGTRNSIIQQLSRDFEYDDTKENNAMFHLFQLIAINYKLS